MPHRLQELLNQLEEENRTPAALLRHVVELARNMAPLAQDLQNITEFYGVVLKISDAMDMLDTECPGLVESLVSKLCVEHGLKWIEYLRKRTPTVALFSPHIGELCTSFLQLRGIGQAMRTATRVPRTGQTAPPQNRQVRGSDQKRG